MLSSFEKKKNEFLPGFQKKKKKIIEFKNKKILVQEIWKTADFF